MYLVQQVQVIKLNQIDCTKNDNIEFGKFLLLFHWIPISVAENSKQKLKWWNLKTCLCLSNRCAEKLGLPIFMTENIFNIINYNFSCSNHCAEKLGLPNLMTENVTKLDPIQIFFQQSLRGETWATLHLCLRWQLPVLWGLLPRL